MNGFSDRIIQWYAANKRELPWRKTSDPYLIWVSEIMLQQTRIDQGLGYYRRFTDRFPDLGSLAAADEQEVLSIWKGLGYYSRARNMHQTAQVIAEKHDGIFPGTYGELLKLKGVGRYTAAAIASLCFGEPVPVVDGNVVRVFSRIFGIDAAAGSSQSFNKVWEKSSELISRGEPGTYNQAVMEFGALFCRPRNPDCGNCVFNKECYAFRNGMTEQLPVKAKTNKRRNRWFNYLCITLDDGQIAVKQRSRNDIWKNLWELPLIEADRLLEPDEIIHHKGIRKTLGDAEVLAVNPVDYKHILTHQTIYARFFEIKAVKPGTTEVSKDFEMVTNPVLSGLPVSRLIERYLIEKEQGTAI